MAEKICCPKCGGEHLQCIVENDAQTTGKNYSGCQGCLGFLLLGPFGLLCGLCGEGKQTTITSTTYWICPDCGNKFKDPNSIKKEISKLDKSVTPAMVVAGICFGLVMGFIVGLYEVSVGVFLGATTFLALLIGGLIMDSSNSSQREALINEARKIENEMSQVRKRNKIETVIEKPVPDVITYDEYGIPELKEPTSATAIKNTNFSNITNLVNDTTTTLNTPSAMPVKVFKDINGMLKCPTCGVQQNGDRFKCFSCGQVFVNGQPDIPYWCNSCGKIGPYDGKCPVCGSSMKLYNNR